MPVHVTSPEQMTVGEPSPAPAVELVSLELTNQCSKACAFCYNHSRPGGGTLWQPAEVISFALDCAEHGVQSFSFGGGEPLEYAGLFEVLAALRGRLFRSITTNGLKLGAAAVQALAGCAVDKVHVSLHFPERPAEVELVLDCVRRLDAAGIRAGVNVAIGASKLDAARNAVARLHAAGIDNERMIYLPMRMHDEPRPEAIARVAGGPFQSTTCLRACAKSPRFVSIDWRKQVAWCSYTATRRALMELTYGGLISALDGLGLRYCGVEAVG